MLPNDPIENIWEALWLGIQLKNACRYFIFLLNKHQDKQYFYLLPNEAIESMWDALWLGIQLKIACRSIERHVFSSVFACRSQDVHVQLHLNRHASRQNHMQQSWHRSDLRPASPVFKTWPVKMMKKPAKLSHVIVKMASLVACGMDTPLPSEGSGSPYPVPSHQLSHM